ncbi:MULTISPECIES: inovirus-type Gp2 protein [Pseudomonas]|uniref:YagK/YfjJ domain-containing protein n=1 Tax=Pseudomonas TaxID=286 RepID=UPI002092165A|nr:MULTISPECIES: inovirus-type Gp2 protein [Pseudomonas]USS56566.1 inovirus Gp2 family protein [Pseudomonas kermanshahensis]UVL67452.1 inovirus Gp2 family protein [Pseudomonas sp. B21-031]
MLVEILNDEDLIGEMVEGQWALMTTEEGSDLLIKSDESSLIYDVCTVTQVVMGLLSKAEMLKVGRSGKRSLTPLGRKTLECLRIDFNRLVAAFPGGAFNPYVYAFVEATGRLMSDEAFWGVSAYPDRLVMGDVVKAFRILAEEVLGVDAGGALKTTLRNAARNARKNLTGLNAYVDALLERYSRLVVVRVDLRYAIGAVDANADSIAIVKSDFNYFLSFVKGKRFGKDVCGYVWKLEYGAVQGWHYHVLLFLNGAKHREDISIGKELGDKWMDITRQKGCYFNCNARKEKYKRPALGVVSWRDFEKVNNLKIAAGYLAKADMLIRPNLAGGERALGKGRMPKGHSGKGRPRQ